MVSTLYDGKKEAVNFSYSQIWAEVGRLVSVHIASTHNCKELYYMVEGPAVTLSAVHIKNCNLRCVALISSC